MKRRTALFGGTFDPIHKGHIQIAIGCLREYSLDRVVLIPALAPPHKTGKAITAYEHRLQMCKIVTEEYKNFEVSDIERALGGVSYTCVTLESVAQLYPQDELFYIIGGDTLFDLKNWYCPEKLAEFATFLCAYRPGTDRAAYDVAAAQLYQKFGIRVLFTEVSGPDISSTMVRKEFIKGNTIEDYVLGGVLAYVQSNGLYK